MKKIIVTHVVCMSNLIAGMFGIWFLGIYAYWEWAGAIQTDLWMTVWIIVSVVLSAILTLKLFLSGDADVFV